MLNANGGGRRKERVTHRDICRAVAKIGAYLRLSDREKAKEWALQLQGYMKTLGLLD
jgi:hypothetical protein